MRQVMIRRGHVVVEEMPAPLIKDNHVLVEVAYSLISPGTEMSNIEVSGQQLVKRAMQRPDQVQQVIDYLRHQGIQKTVAKVRGQLDAGSPLGYSCAGVVLQTGLGISDIEPGDLVACAGGGIATHSEIVLVPRNLVVKVPSGCDLRGAASVTLGAIAMQGLRRADPQLGEVIAVIGLGLLGQLTVQLLKAAGCQVIGFDLDERRVTLAQELGMAFGASPTQVDVAAEVRNRTSGHGVDATIITAATSSDAVVQQAMEITRKKGRVVVVGSVGLGLKRSPFYEKEIDFLISSSYGPGRYDSAYEEQGVDYPYAYVRWTENRNMAEYLRLVAERHVKLERILEQEYELSEASKAYEVLRTAPSKPLGVLLCYPLSVGGDPQVRSPKLHTRVELPSKPAGSRIRVAIIGAGNFARATHLPNLQKLNDLFQVKAVVSATGSHATAAARQFGASYASTSYDDVLNDDEVDAVVITTRHNLHAEQVIAALQAGKHVYCEKPLVLKQQELDDIVSCYGLTIEDLQPDGHAPDLRDPRPVLTVGFNRRFSPAVKRIKQIASTRQNPLMIVYRANAGYVPPDSWVHGPEGGGRLIGEACHMLDVFQYLVDAPVADVCAQRLVPQTDHVQASENAGVVVRYADGSVCTLLYTSLGASGLDKERIEVHVDSKSMLVTDYQKLEVLGMAKQNWSNLIADKGHLAALEAWGKAVRFGGAWPISLYDLVTVSQLSLEIAGTRQRGSLGE